MDSDSNRERKDDGPSSTRESNESLFTRLRKHGIKGTVYGALGANATQRVPRTEFRAADGRRLIDHTNTPSIYAVDRFCVDDAGGQARVVVAGMWSTRFVLIVIAWVVLSAALVAYSCSRAPWSLSLLQAGGVGGLVAIGGVSTVLWVFRRQQQTKQRVLLECGGDGVHACDGARLPDLKEIVILQGTHSSQSMKAVPFAALAIRDEARELKLFYRDDFARWSKSAKQAIRQYAARHGLTVQEDSVYVVESMTRIG